MAVAEVIKTHSVFIEIVKVSLNQETRLRWLVK